MSFNERLDNTIEELWEEELLFLKTIGSFESTLGNERKIQLFLEQYLNDLKLETSSFDVDERKISNYQNYGIPVKDYNDRPVVVGVRKSNTEKTGKSLILQAHIDVVDAGPYDHWDTDPYSPTIKDNKMYGRGILDMKGGLAANIFALKALEKMNENIHGDIQIQTVIEEEVTGNGALALLEAGYIADGALIPEPMQHRILTSQVGVFYIRVTVKGVGAHVERAEEAVNATANAYKIIQSLEEYREFINSQEKHEAFKNNPHPLNVNVGKIEGGDWTSSVPVECTFEARVGCYPDKDPKEAKKEVKEWIIKSCENDEWLKDHLPEIEFFGFNAPGFEVDRNDVLYNTLSESHKNIIGHSVEDVAFTATTDARAFDEFDIPATCYGPKGNYMHAPNEYIDLDSLKNTTKVIAHFVKKWCNREK